MRMAATMYHVISLVLHAGHRVRAQPARLPQVGHFILLSRIRVFEKLKQACYLVGGTLAYAASLVWF